MLIRTLKHDIDFVLAGITALIFGFFYLVQIVGLILLIIGVALCLVRCTLMLIYSSDIGTIPLISKLIDN